jgi:hypothetical protein
MIGGERSAGRVATLPAAAEQWRRGCGNSDGGAGKGDAQQCAAPGASMWPREDARQATGRGGSAEGRARLDQQAARGAIGMHKEGFRRSWG